MIKRRSLWEKERVYDKKKDSMIKRRSLWEKEGIYDKKM